MVLLQHALAMLALPILTTVVCVRSYKKRPRALQLIVALLGGVGFIFVLSILSTHMCPKGGGGPQILLGGACMTATASLISDLKFRLALCTLLAAASWALSWQSIHLVHRSDLTGSPGEVIRAERGLKFGSRLVKESVEGDPIHGTRSFPPGWVHETDAWTSSKRLREYLQDSPPYRPIITPFWHTWLTGIYARREQPVRLWHPGGVLKDAVDRFEWRDFSG